MFQAPLMMPINVCKVLDTDMTASQQGVFLSWLILVLAQFSTEHTVIVSSHGIQQASVTAMAYK